MDKFGIGVLVALVFGAILALGVSVVMFWTALMHEYFGYFAPIGFGQSALFFVLTSTLYSLITVKGTVKKTVGE